MPRSGRRLCRRLFKNRFLDFRLPCDKVTWFYRISTMQRKCVLVLGFLLSACQQFDSPNMAGMSEGERNSYVAVTRYLGCMRPFVKLAKMGPPLSDGQVDTLGYRCLSELQDAARKREIYFSAMPPSDRDPSLSAPTQTERIRLQEKDLAGIFWCELRKCIAM